MQGDFGYVTGLRQGDLLAGKYRVERVLGRGGMGVVVAAQHVQLEERVAIKFLLPEALHNPEAVARFTREARAAVKIKSEHVAAVKDVGTLDNGAPYMIMEYLEGFDLAQRVREGGPLPVEQAVEFVLQACVAVAEAHSLGIVHRDLKPANLFCVRRADGLLSIKVLDFGISKRTDLSGSDPSASMTQTMAIVGSPLYMSPEQLRSAKAADARSDIWSLGVSLYELVAGRAPFLAEGLPSLVLLVTNEAPPPLSTFRPDVHPAFEAALFKSLAKDPAQRYANVAHMALALLPFAPPRARASFERISGIVSSLQAERSPTLLDPGPMPSLGASQMPGVERTTAPPRPRGAPMLAGALLAVAVLGIGVMVFFGIRLATQARSGSGVRATSAAGHGSAPSPAVTPPVAAEAAAEPAPSREPAPSASSAVRAPQEATTNAPPLPSASPVSSARPRQGSSSGAAPRASAGPVGPYDHRQPGGPTCTIATDYDPQGQPHFTKVCK